MNNNEDIIITCNYCHVYCSCVVGCSVMGLLGKLSVNENVWNNHEIIKGHITYTCWTYCIVDVYACTVSIDNCHSLSVSIE